uniref:Chlorophyll a-b binding protein, chloroplastic n=1 Tax=Schistosoma curassoni TaxID=6186 RepID=A0A183L168_9TREM
MASLISSLSYVEPSTEGSDPKYGWIPARPNTLNTAFTDGVFVEQLALPLGWLDPIDPF